MITKRNVVLALLSTCGVVLFPACHGLSSGVAQPPPAPTATLAAPDPGALALAGNARLVTALLVGFLLIGGLLLVGALLVWLLKSRRVERAALAPQSPSLAAPPALPERTLLYGGRYRVLRLREATETCNVYTARGAVPLNRCPNCDAPIVIEDGQSCAQCGADLREMTLVYPEFLVRETADARAFVESAQLTALRLQHPALIAPVQVFEETAFEPVRYYRVEPLFKWAPDVSPPQPPEKVLAWGIALAQGLAYLHHRYLVLPKLDLEHIAMDHGRARFVCIDNVRILPHALYPEAGRYFSENVQALAGLLLSLLDESTASLDALVTLLRQAQQTGGTARAFAASLEGALCRVRAPEKVQLRVGHLTDVGRLRSLNEDSVLALELTGRFPALEMPVGVFAVADGMGGHAAGDIASQLTIVAIQDATETLSAADNDALPDARIWLEEAVAAANQAVYAERREAGNDMGCTLVCAVAVGGYVTIANIGDSRAYWLTAEGITQVTTDHSLVERLVAAGHITPQEAREHPQRNVIYRVVGDKPKADFDLFEQSLAPGEAALLCSDGLSGMVPDAQIWEIWRAASSPQTACEQLIAAANAAGGADNISVVIIQVV